MSSSKKPPNDPSAPLIDNRKPEHPFAKLELDPKTRLLTYKTNIPFCYITDIQVLMQPLVLKFRTIAERIPQYSFIDHETGRVKTVEDKEETTRNDMQKVWAENTLEYFEGMIQKANNELQEVVERFASKNPLKKRNLKIAPLQKRLKFLIYLVDPFLHSWHDESGSFRYDLQKVENYVFESDEKAGLFDKRTFDKELVKELRIKRDELKRWENFFHSEINCNELRFYTVKY